jgi:hypothetical protein
MAGSLNLALNFRTLSEPTWAVQLSARSGTALYLRCSAADLSNNSRIPQMRRRGQLQAIDSTIDTSIYIYFLSTFQISHIYFRPTLEDAVTDCHPFEIAGAAALPSGNFREAPPLRYG